MPSMRMDQLTTFKIPKEIVDIWKRTMGEELLPVQELAVSKGLFDGKSLCVVAPSSSGKTFVAEMASIKNALSGNRVLYLLPLKALAEEKCLDFREKYLRDLDVYIAISTRDHQEDDERIENGEFDIAILVYEKFSQIYNFPIIIKFDLNIRINCIGYIVKAII